MPGRERTVLSDFMLALIATACGRAGQWDEGLRRVDEGIALVATTCESVYAAELWRIKGELLLGKGRRPTGGRAAAGGRVTEAAGKCFRRSLEIAGAQEARSLALRSAMSLARVSVGHDGVREARQLLRTIYASFTEGFDTADLRSAKALLNELER